MNPVVPGRHPDWLLATDVFAGHATAILAASLVAGLVAGAVALAVAALGGYSWAPPRAIAARVLSMPFERAGSSLAAVVHFALAVLALVVVGATVLGAAQLLAAVGAPGFPLLGAGPFVVGALLLVGGLGLWIGLVRGWLPEVAAAAGVPTETLRNQALTVGIVYGAAAVVVYPLVLFVAMMLIFFR